MTSVHCHHPIWICPVGALAFHLFGRFHVSHESPFPTWLPGSSGTTSVCSEGKVSLRSPTASSTGQSKPVNKLCKFCLPRKRTQCEVQVQLYIDSSLV